MKLKDLQEEIVKLGGLEVSHATLRTEDLLEAFVEVVADENLGKAEKILKDVEEYPEECVNDLFDLLDSQSPEGYFFGNLPGDASDFGWWSNDLAEDY